MPSSQSSVPSIPISVPICAKIIDVHPTTLRRAIREAAEGRPFSSDREKVTRCARVFAQADSPIRREAPVGEIARAAGVTEEFCETKARETLGRAGPPPSRSRPALSKSEEASWPLLATGRLVERLREAWIDMETRDSLNKRRRIAGIGAELSKRGVLLVDGFMDWTKVRLFMGSLEAWLSGGDPRSRVLFVRGPAPSRPIHVSLARPGDLLRARSLVLLTVGEYCAELAAATSEELSAIEARELGGVARRPDDSPKTERGKRRRMARDDS